MKKYLMMFCMAVSFIAQTCFAQDENRIKEIAFDYLLQNIESISARPWSVSNSRCDKMSSGDYLVALTIKRTLTEKREELVANQVHAYGATFNVGVREGTVSRDYGQTKSYLVFIDRNGEPSNYIGGTTDYEFKNWHGNAWLIMYKHEDEDGKEILPYYGNVSCFNNKGEKLLSIHDMRIYDWKYSGNTLYLVGKMGINDRSVVRAVDVKTCKYEEKLGGTDVLPYKISFEGEGVKITQKTESGSSSSYMFPYASSDKDLREKKDAEFERILKSGTRNEKLELAKNYSIGNGVINDKVVKLYKSLADAGELDFKIKIAQMYETGKGLEKNFDKAAEAYFELANDYGNEDGVNFLFKNLQQVIKIPKLVELISKAYVPHGTYNNNHAWKMVCLWGACTSGNLTAVVELADYFYEQKEINPAIALYQGAAEDGSTDAMYKLGKLYLDSSSGDLMDVEKGIMWYTKAADGGHGDARLELGTFYKDGIHVKKDKTKAKMYLQ